MINKGKRMGNAKNTPFCMVVKDFLGCAEQNETQSVPDI